MKILEDEVIDVAVPANADVIVLQRVSHNWHSKVIGLMREKGVAVVIDMDDDLSCIHPENKAYRYFHPRSNTPYSWKNVEQSCKDATLVTTSTKPLLGVYAKHGRGQVLDNYVPARYLDIPHSEKGYFGWPGTTGSHPNDLQVMGTTVRDLIAEGYPFKVVGPKSKVKDALRLTTEPEYTGIIDLDKWANEIAELSVVIAPLAVGQFNESKSRLKLIEAMAAGVPWVASPRSEYRRVHAESGAGLLADTPKQWGKAIRQLMSDDVMRKELGERGRQYMQDQTIEANAWRWMEAWTRAYDIQRGKGK